MSLIDSTYFTGELLIPGASTDTHLAQAITQYEKEILIRLLGYKLYSLLQADLSGGDPQTQIYIDLVDGAEFTHNFNGQEILLKWEGLRNTTTKLSLIAYYVFYKYVERHMVEYHGTGFSVASNGKDWTRANPSFKLAYTWDRMRELYGKVPPQYETFFSYPVKGSDLFGVFDQEPSAYNFLYANKANYPDWIFDPVWNVNAFGI